MNFKVELFPILIYSSMESAALL
jgi:hypothetical protein